MTAVAHLNALYSAAPIILWVEDTVTRDYLAKVLADPPEISFLIAGGNSSISPTVLAAKQEGIGHVFGLVDRDFNRSAKPNWLSPQTGVYYLPRHEVENYMLDAQAACGCTLHNRKRTLSDIETELHRLASSQPAWLACRQILTRMRQEVLDDFPSHPKLDDISTVAQAEQLISAAPWFTQLATTATSWKTPGRISAELQTAEGAFAAALTNGDWALDFSGKEIFRRLRDYVYQPPQNPGYPDNDFAKAIGEWQEANGQVPADLVQLRSALRSKVGLPP